MARLHLERKTTSSPEQILSRFESEVLTLPSFKTFVDRYEIQGNRVTFEGSRGFSGAVEVRPGILVVDITLSGMAVLMKRLIEGKLSEVLERLD